MIERLEYTLTPPPPCPTNEDHLMIECPEYTLTLPPPCPTNRDHLGSPLLTQTLIHHRSLPKCVLTPPLFYS